MTQNHLLHIGLDLRDRIGQFVEGVVHLFRADAILHRDGNGDEDVVLGLGFHGQRDLIYAQAYPAGNSVEVRHLPIQSGIGDAKKLAEAGDHGHLCRVDREKASHNQGKCDDGDNRQQNHEECGHFESSVTSRGGQRDDYISTPGQASCATGGALPLFAPATRNLLK